MTPKAAVWAVWGVVWPCASDWRARAVIWEVFRGRKAPVANRDAKSSKCGGVVYNFWTLTCQIWSDNSLGAHPSKGASAPLEGCCIQNWSKFGKLCIHFVFILSIHREQCVPLQVGPSLCSKLRESLAQALRIILHG